jgi:cytochrome c oxidase subunit 3
LADSYAARAAHAGAHDAPPELRHHFVDLPAQREASTLGMWIFLATEVLFFGGMFSAYVVYRATYRTAFEIASNQLDITLGAFNTAVLILSSLTMALAVWASSLGKKNLIVLFLILTILLGGVFLGVKVVEYKQKFDHHEVPGPHYAPVDERTHQPLPPQSELFFSLYFCMTGLHALHMIIGIGLLSWLIVKAQKGAFTPRYYTPVDMVGLYWHFVDIVWIFLFPLLYLLGRHTL